MDVQKLVANIPINSITHKLEGTNASKISAPDRFSTSSNVAQIINSKLKNIYGINSSIQDKTLLGKVYAVVQEFCELNSDDKLFHNLTLRTCNLLLKKFSQVTKIQNNYTLSFNKNTDWKNIEQITKDLFNKGFVGSKNPKYLIYQGFGDFLNFSNNPKARYESANLFYEGSSSTLPFRICNSTNLEAFNSHATAALMSKEFLPADIEKYLRENMGNLSLKFPEVPERFLTGSEITFSSTNEASRYLREFGIDAEFLNIEQANTCTQAIEDLIQAIGNKEIFSGLSIKTQALNDMDEKTVAEFEYNMETFKNCIYLNPNFDWQSADKLAKEDFHMCHHPTTKSKDNFIHELSHYLDFIGNPKNFIEMDKKFGGFNASGIFATSKVSEYAAEHPAEFCAEYICGKMGGVEYPEGTNNLFAQFWNGCKLNFPKTK